MKRPRYRDAVEFIALNDNAGDSEPAEAIAGYMTVALVSEIFGTPAARVAADVIKCRQQLEQLQGAQQQ
jgi:hypothetical protein